MRMLLPIVALALLAGCKHRPPAMTEMRVTYACDRAPGMIVEYSGETARIISPSSDAVVELQRKPTRSGFWYESPTHSIRGKGKRITYGLGRMVPMICTAS
jgi:hypothetical protein